MGLKDYIFVTGASGIGKTTLANGILAHYRTTCIEQNMIPEFISRDGIEPMTKLEYVVYLGKDMDEQRIYEF